MSPPRGAPLASSSPHSENDTTFHGTPSTNPTSFTPEAVPGKHGKGRAQDAKPVHTFFISLENPDRYVSTDIHTSSVLTLFSANDDVFLNAPTPTNAVQLSPTAEVFTPGVLKTGVKDNTVNNGAKYPRANGSAATGHHHRQGAQDVGNIGVRPLLKGSTPDGKPKALTREQAQVNAPGVIGGPRAADQDINAFADRLANFGIGEHRNNAYGGVSIHDVHFREGTFSTDDLAPRAFVIMGIPAHRNTVLLDAFQVSLPPHHTTC